MDQTTDSRKKPGLIVRVLRGFWRGVDSTRRFTINLIFLLLALWLLSLFLASAPKLQPRTALVIAPKGALVEQYTVDPASRAIARALGEETPEVQLRDLLRAIEAAKDDDRIERIVIRPDGLRSAGLAALREVAAALREFRESGKQVVAYADFLDQRQYLLAAQADEIYLHPSGAVLMEGFARYRPYYREGLQDKLGVDVHLFRVGEYKSAAEPYILDAPSAEDREANLFWMNDLWRRHLGDIASARGLEADALHAAIEDMPARLRAAGGDLAEMALRQRLVDALKTLDQVRALLVERGVPDTRHHTFRQVSLDDYLGFIDRETLPVDKRPQVAVVVAQGTIVDGDRPPGMVGGESTAWLLRQAREDDNVKAVVLRVDSPGGGVFPSEQIRREVELLRAAGKPVVASMANVAASGGYWISMDADAIYADASTITGSIGIFGLWMSVPRTLEKIGVRVDGVGTTRFAGAFDPTRPLDPAVGELIQSVIENGYRDFIDKVAAARERDEDAIDAVARGRVWSGAQAHERGLVDALGGLRDAVAKAAELAELPAGRYRLGWIEKPLSTFEKFIASFGADARARAVLEWSGVARLLGGSRTGAQIGRDLQWLSEQQGRPPQGVAHCFCGL